MSDLLSIGSSGVAAYQRALTTVSNNISNVGTEGYVRQETALAENMPRQQGRVYLGTGVNVAGINRAYDQFLEQNLRNSTSELNTQGPMVNYANRVVDIMGSDTVGLNNSLDKFFATARSLSVDPSSIVLRQQFLRDADGLAAGFRELSNQMTTVDTETRDAINARVADINTLAGQIATVNKQMAKHPLASRQPPDLLDQRDLLLTKLSKLVKINVTTAQNGAADISIGTVASAGKIVVGDRSTTLMARFDEKDLSRVSIVLDPYAKYPSEVAGVSSGELGGLMGFREQVLQPSFEALDNLATMVAGELNQIHANGIDLDGEVGKPMFTIDKITRMDPLERTTVQIDRASAGIRVVIDDPNKIAAGALFRVIENPNNLSGTDAVLTYEPSYADPSRVRSLSQVLKNNPNSSAGISAPADQLLGQIPIGASNWSVFMDNATDKQNIQVLTRDGRHLLGAPITDEAARRALLTTNNGFIQGTTYSDTYLNETDETGYKQMSMFYGLKSLAGTQYDQATQFSTEHMVVPSTIERNVLIGEVIPADIQMIAADRLTINGHSLPALYPTAPAQTIQASDIAEWMNKAVENDDPPVAVNATTTTTDLSIDPEEGLYINGAAIPAESGRTLASLVLQINSQYASDANVFATLNDAGDALVLTNAEGYGGNDIWVGGMDDDGDITTSVGYRGMLNFGELSDITIGYGTQGRAGDLAPLGQPLGEYFNGLMPIIPTAARIGSTRIPAGVESIAANTLTLNGVTLGGIDYNRPLKAPDLAAWLNATGSTLEPPVVVRGVNQIKANAALIEEGLDEDRSLVVNGVSISGTGTGGIFVSTQEIAAAINGAETGRVVASAGALNLSRSLSINGTVITGSGANGTFLDSDELVSVVNLYATFIGTGVTAEKDSVTGDITLSNANGEDIIIGPLDEGNALGVASGTYSKVYAEMDKFGNLLISNGSGADISISTLSGGANILGVSNGTYRGTIELGSDEEIRFGFTDEHVESGPAELAKLGLRTGIYIDGAVQEDLLVFVSAGSGTIAGSYDASMADPASLNTKRIEALRAEKYDVTFTSEKQYQITWRNPSTGVMTVLAEREYDPKQGIEYRGVHLMLNRPPVSGDTFLIDGNQDGTGNNQNMLDIVALQTKGVVGGSGGRTISQAYEEQLGRVGNFASQAKIAQDALKVVNDQAIESRDKVSGVSLDSEAADLIRFQQAYQASAKAMQVSGDLFDAILQAAR
jgi:flagellar hook-associated protein 1 FlgK